MFFAPVSVRRAVTQPLNGASRGYVRPSLLDSVLDDFFEPAFVPAQRGVSIEATGQGHRLTLDVPGLAREHLTLTIEERVVRVESKADAPRAVKAAWQFAEDIDASASSARLENGVLTLELVRKQPVSNATVIEIR